MPKNYELIEHTADLCFLVKAKTLSELFQNAAAAVFDLLAEKKSSTTTFTPFTITERAADREELLINWLNELLSLSAVKGVVFTEFKILDLKDTSIKAIAQGQGVRDFERKIEIKAATYHQLKVEEGPEGFSAQVILDV